MILPSGFAEASCAGVIRTARDVVADFGEAAVSAMSEGLLKLSKRSTNQGERDCRRLLAKQMKLTLPIPKTFLDTKDKCLKIPFLRARDWLMFFLQNNCLHILCGLLSPDHKRQGDIWEAWWRNFEVQNPNHPVFTRSRSGEINLRQTIPIVVHGDEGRSKKNAPFLVLSFHSLLGRGIETELHGPNPRKRKYVKMLCNFVGHSYTNRYLLSALPKEDYTNKNSFVFEILMKTLVDELTHLADVGVSHDGSQYHVYCIGMAGDWPWLVKSGSLQRSFWNVAKHPGQANRAEGKGICHLCMAGRRAFPYEELGTRRPAWLASVLTQPPFDEANHPFNFHVVPHEAGQLPTLWKFDIFHTVHLGIGKNYLGSMLALLSQQEAGGNIDVRFELLSAKYLSWCSANHRRYHCKRITKEHLNWVSTTCYPTGSWHKGDLTTSLLLFCEAMYQSEAWEDETLRLAGQAAEALNSFLRLLYHAEAWLSKDEGFEAAQLGLRFLRRYSDLAKLAHSQGQRLWLVMPKAHSFHHICLQLLDQSKVGVCINPLCFSVQQDEDFIGRGARLSRHVSSVHCSERTVDRYLMASYAKFVESGYLVVAKG